MRKICVVGSLNTDLVASAERFPKPGETLLGKEFGTYPGGKGANQAVAAGRLQADVRMIGKVGDDLYGKQDLINLKQNGVNCDGVDTDPSISSGIAVIEVDGKGENHILVIPGANNTVDTRFIDKKLNFMLESEIFLFQLEIPLDTVIYTIQKLKESGKTIILDPAPAIILPDEIYQYIDYITPNETEILIITGKESKIETDLRRSAATLIQKGVGTVVIKAGEKGAYIINRNEFIHIPGFPVRPVDTTGAGDSFNAGLAVSLAQGYSLKESVRFANAVGALSTLAKGAQNAMPTLDEVKGFLKNHSLNFQRQ
ncbi:MAG: ribokinase [Bacteroidota bacterium]